VLKFKITCDGSYPEEGRGPCPCEITVEGSTREDAMEIAKQYGWSLQYYRGFLCNAVNGHRDDDKYHDGRLPEEGEKA